MTTGNVRPADMERITTPALAQKFIDEQIEELRRKAGYQATAAIELM